MSEITLQEFVKRRTGLPLGARGSLRAMLLKSFGASSFERFWHFWNPIWAFYLSKSVMRPAGKIVPAPAAVLITFGVSGFLHDLAVSLVKLAPFYFFTQWFLLMGAIVIVFKQLKIQYKPLSVPWRMFVNASILAVSFLLVRALSF